MPNMSSSGFPCLFHVAEPACSFEITKLLTIQSLGWKILSRVVDCQDVCSCFWKGFVLFFFSCEGIFVQSSGVSSFKTISYGLDSATKAWYFSCRVLFLASSWMIFDAFKSPPSLILKYISDFGLYSQNLLLAHLSLYFSTCLLPQTFHCRIVTIQSFKMSYATIGAPTPFSTLKTALISP